MTRDRDMGGNGLDSAKGARPGMARADDAVFGPLPGMDGLAFRNLVARALAGDESVPAVMATLVNAALRGVDRGKEEQERRWHELFWRQVLEARLREIDDLIGQYNRMADWHNDQAGIAKAKMQEAGDRLEAIGEFIDGVDDVLQGKATDGKLDREKAIRLLQSRGVEVDASEDDVTVLARLYEERRKAFDERAHWSAAYEASKTDADHHSDFEKDLRSKAQELIEKRDAIRAGGFDPEDEARRLKEVADEYQIRTQQQVMRMERDRAGQKLDIAEKSEEAMKLANAEQSASEVSDFEALAGSLTGKFTEAASNMVDTSTPDYTPPQRSGPTGPGVRA